MIGGGAVWLPASNPRPAGPNACGPHRAPGPNPAVGALTALLAEAQAATTGRPSLAHRFVRQLAMLAEGAGTRLAALFSRDAPSEAVRGGGPEAATAAADQPATTNALAPLPRMPLQPPGPLLTLDPTLGTIVADDGAPAGPPGTGTGTGSGTGAASVGSAGSWVPVTGALTRIGDAGRAGARRVFGVVDRLVERTGLTRGQFVVLTFLAPFVVAFLIDAVASMLGGN